jgi:DNA-binding NarL/FixJ family response regulator
MSPQIARRVLNMFAQLNAPRFDYGLTDRERDVLNELVAGKTKKRIARDLHLSTHTVDTHLRSIYGKLHVNTQTAAVAKALTEKLIP